MRLNSLLTFLTISLSVTRAVSGEHKRTPNQTTLLDGDGSIIQPLSALDLAKQQAVLGVETRELEEEHIALIHAITENQPDIATKILERTDVGINVADRPWPASNNDCDMTNQNTSSAGGGQSHENRPPYYALMFIMKL